jgi:hypothetical protein
VAAQHPRPAAGRVTHNAASDGSGCSGSRTKGDVTAPIARPGRIDDAIGIPIMRYLSTSSTLKMTSTGNRTYRSDSILLTR